MIINVDFPLNGVFRAAGEVEIEVTSFTPGDYGDHYSPPTQSEIDWRFISAELNFCNDAGTKDFDISITEMNKERYPELLKKIEATLEECEDAMITSHRQDILEELF